MTEEETRDRDEVSRVNRDQLSAVLARHADIYISRREMDKWRPTVKTTGSVDGFYHLGTMTCVATDGLQAWFVLDSGKAWIGHVGHFHWDVPVISFVPYIDEHGNEKFFKSVKDQGAPSAFARRKQKERKPREKKAKVSIIDKAINALMKGISLNDSRKSNTRTTKTATNG